MRSEANEHQHSNIAVHIHCNKYSSVCVLFASAIYYAITRKIVCFIIVNWTICQAKNPLPPDYAAQSNSVILSIFECKQSNYGFVLDKLIKHLLNWHESIYECTFNFTDIWMCLVQIHGCTVCVQILAKLHYQLWVCNAKHVHVQIHINVFEMKHESLDEIYRNRGR